MSKTENIRLRHMLDAARTAMAFAQGRSRADLDADEMLTLALVRLLETLGEAANSLLPAVSDTILKQYIIPVSPVNVALVSRVNRKE